MIERFQGTSGERLLRDAMLAQQCVCHRDLVADALCAVAELVELKEGEVLVREGAEDNDIYLIISGSVSVRKYPMFASRYTTVTNAVPTIRDFGRLR